MSLYRYDLTQGMARSLGPMLIGRPLEGIWHTSIVVFGKEYYFDGGVGIVGDPNPGRTRFGAPYRTEVLGQTTKREEEFFAWTQQQRRSGFGPNDYRIFDNNCNSFSDAACMYLLGRHISQDVLDMIPTLLSTRMGQMLRPMLEQATSGGAGVGGTGMVAPPAPRPPASAPAGTSSADECAGLLSQRGSLTESDEDDLVMAQAMLESNETIADGPRSPAEAFEKTISGLTLLRTVMLNICQNPTSARYRAISTESNAYRTKLKPLETYGVTELLRVAGFRRRPHSSGTGGEQWFLSDSDGSAGVLGRVADALETTIANIQAAADEAAGLRLQASAGAEEDSGAQASTTTTAPASASGPSPSSARDDGGVAPLKTPPAPANHVQAHRSDVLRYCSPPFPTVWVPLPVGREAGTALFSIHCLATSSADGPYCFGKCRLSGANQQHLQAHYCSSDGKEVEIRGGYEVLCVRRGQQPQQALTWVPASLAFTQQQQQQATSPDESFIFTGYGRFAVARAEHGCGVHPGVMEPSGRCVIPYGGRAVVVTDVAEVLCETARLPPSVAEETAALQRGHDLAELVRAASGLPISSFDDLLTSWQPPAFYMKPCPLRTCTPVGVRSVKWTANTGTAEGGAAVASVGGGDAEGDGSAARLLVCHDYGGGYTSGDRRLFLCGDGAADRLPGVESAYTVSYWDRADAFVYFSHQRVSIPPREWIECGHRHGVPVLGTVITEGESGHADLQLLLTDATRMATIIARLAAVCDTHGFDGYLINIENSLPETLAKRLVVFCTQLRKQLNRAPAPATPRLVVWYDAVTIDGRLHYQNTLNARNKPFFDVSSGIFVNYFWNPMHLALAKTAAGSRGLDAYVGVDVFGRHMYGGGGYNTHVAVTEVAKARLSVALFAPGWAMESESKGTRDGFQVADSCLWSRMQEKFAYHTRVVSATHAGTEAHHRLRAWTSYRSGVGYSFYVNGRCISGSCGISSSSGTDGSGNRRSGWCELSGAHGVPAFFFEAPPAAPPHPAAAAAAAAAPAPAAPFAPVPIRLPVAPLQGNLYGGVARAEWRFDAAWFGDRHLACLVPPMEAAEVLRWYVRDALPAGSAGTELHVEAVYLVPEAAQGERAAAPRGLRLGLYCASRGAFFATVWETAAATTPATLAEPLVALEGCGGHVRASATHAPGTAASPRWERVTYRLENTSQESIHLISLSVANGDARRTMQCGVGGLAVFHRARIEATPTNASDAAADTVGAAASPRSSVLRALGPYQWARDHTHRTHRTAEQVLVLSGADAAFARLRARHGVHESLVVFARIGNAAASLHSDPAVAVTQAAAEEDAAEVEVPCDGEGELMYLGQYPLLPEACATHDDALLVPIALPTSACVAAVHYYIVSEGY